MRFLFQVLKQEENILASTFEIWRLSDSESVMIAVKAFDNIEQMAHFVHEKLATDLLHIFVYIHYHVPVEHADLYSTLVRFFNESPQGVSPLDITASFG